MDIGICNMCIRRECKNGSKYSSDLTVCSAFLGDIQIDWEQRRYELANHLYIKLMGKEFRVPDGVTAKDIQDQFSEQAINAATAFIEKYRED